MRGTGYAKGTLSVSNKEAHVCGGWKVGKSSETSFPLINKSYSSMLPPVTIVQKCM